MRVSPTRHRVALVVALAGAALSVVTFVIHQRVATGGYTSFCNLGGVFNCDLVVTSRFGTLLDVPVSLWSLAAFLAGAGLALPGALGAAAWLADLLLVGLVTASVGFAVVLLVVSLAVLHHLCILCLSMDAVIIAWAVAVVPLVRRFDPSPRASGWWRRRAVARASATAGLLLAVAGGTWAAVRTPAPAATPEDVRARDPKFYEWYTKLPVRPLGDLTTPVSHVKGPRDARIAIVEFSDFQCPFCVQAFRDLRDLVRRKPEVSLAFRHFPLDAACNPHVTRTLHPDACLAAVAAECAGQQGRFWEYHDLLFTNHESLERESLFRYARETHLDIPAFRACLDDPATVARVRNDVDAGARVGVGSTPTIFINGRAVEGALEPPYWDYALILERNAHPHIPGAAS